MASYLNDKEEFCFIAAEASPTIKEKWAINSGIFLVNLKHLQGQNLVNIYHHLCETRVPETYWDNPEATWAPPEYDDQNILYGILAGMPEIFNSMYKATSTELNYESNSIRQILRTHGSLEERISDLKSRCNASLQYFIARQFPTFTRAYNILSDA